MVRVDWNSFVSLFFDNIYKSSFNYEITKKAFFFSRLLSTSTYETVLLLQVKEVKGGRLKQDFYFTTLFI